MEDQDSGYTDQYRKAIETMKTRRQGHSIKALVEHLSESQALQVARQGHSINALVEHIPESQALQVARQGRSARSLDQGFG